MSEEHEVQFGTLDEQGHYSKGRKIKQSSMAACPHFIMVPEHYREDGSCRCDDPDHTLMSEWEYEWDEAKGRWV